MYLSSNENRLPSDDTTLYYSARVFSTYQIHTGGTGLIVLFRLVTNVK